VTAPDVGKLVHAIEVHGNDAAYLVDAIIRLSEGSCMADPTVNALAYKLKDQVYELLEAIGETAAVETARQHQVDMLFGRKTDDDRRKELDQMRARCAAMERRLGLAPAEATGS
jgi:hypothetical protein